MLHADCIVDFTSGEDVIDLIGGLTLAELNIVRGTGANANNTMLQDRITGEFLAILKGIDPASLSVADFTPATETLSTIAFSDPNYSIDEDSSSDRAVTLTRTGNTNLAASITLTLTQGTASTDDFDSTPIVVEFAPGETEKSISIPIVNDESVESANETIQLSLSNPGNGVAIGSQGTAELTIVDDEPSVSPSPSPTPSPSPSPSPTPSPDPEPEPEPGTIAFSAAEFSINEDGTPVAAITVERTDGSDGEVSVEIQLSDGTAIAPDDFADTPIALTFADGETGEQTVTLPASQIIDDSDDETDETVNLTLANPTADATIGSQNTAVLTLVDNDETPPPATEVTIAVSDAEAAEDGQDPATFTITRTGLTADPLTVAFQLDGTSTVDGSDYSLSDGTNAVTNSITIPAGAASIDLILTPADDTDAEGNESLTFQLTGVSDPDASIGATDTASATLADNEATVSISAIADPAEGTGTPGQVAIERTGSTASALDVNYTIGGSATNGDDYSTLSGTVTINAGDTTATIDIDAMNDGVVEGDETLELTLDSTSDDPNVTLIGTTTATLTLTDNEITLSAPNGGNFGLSLASDGTNLLIGAPNAEQAYRYDTNGDLVRTLAQGAGDFGWSVALNGDNYYVGAPLVDGAVNDVGAVYQFDGDGNNTSVFNNPTTSDGGEFGGAIALVGNKVAIGVPEEDLNGNTNSGVVQVFDGSGGTPVTIENPTPQANPLSLSVIPGFPEDERFGFSIAAAGSDLLIGAPLAVNNTIPTSPTSYAGEAYLFDTAGNLQQTFENPNPSLLDGFGTAVASNGSEVLIGAPGESGQDGVAYLFDIATGNLLETLTNPDSSNRGFGAAVAFTPSGDLLIGSPGGIDTSTFAVNPDPGAVYLYDSGNFTTPLATFENSSGNDEGFGAALTPIGDRVLVGAPFSAGGDGAAYILDFA